MKRAFRGIVACGVDAGLGVAVDLDDVVGRVEVSDGRMNPRQRSAQRFRRIGIDEKLATLEAYLGVDVVHARPVR